MGKDVQAQAAVKKLLVFSTIVTTAGTILEMQTIVATEETPIAANTHTILDKEEPDNISQVVPVATSQEDVLLTDVNGHQDTTLLTTTTIALIIKEEAVPDTHHAAAIGIVLEVTNAVTSMDIVNAFIPTFRRFFKSKNWA